ncbi:MAG: O-antigen ligase family protein [Candidatus Ozemobacteraceae bacterium]
MACFPQSQPGILERHPAGERVKGALLLAAFAGAYLCLLFPPANTLHMEVGLSLFVFIVWLISDDRKPSLALVSVLFVLCLATLCSHVPALSLHVGGLHLCYVLGCASFYRVSRRSAGMFSSLLMIAFFAQSAAVIKETLFLPDQPLHWIDSAGAGWRRLGLFFDSPNTLGVHAAFVGVLLLWKSADDRLWGRSRFQLAAGISSFLIALATLSRSAFISLCAGLLWWLIQTRRGVGKNFVLIGLILLGGFVALHNGFQARLTPLFDLRTYESDPRLFMWKTELKILAAYPWMGVGPGVAPAAYPSFRDPNSTEDWVLLSEIGHLHNDYLQLLCEYGLFPWLLLGGLWLFSTRKNNPGCDTMVPSAGASPRNGYAEPPFPWPAVVVLGFSAMFQSHLDCAPFAFVCFSLMGSLFGSRLSQRDLADRPTGVSSILQWSAIVIPAFYLLGMGWQMYLISDLKSLPTTSSKVEIERSRERIQAITRRGPWLANAWRSLGWQALGMGDTVQARSHFRRAMQWNPFDAMIRVDLAAAETDAGGRLEDIGAYWKEAVMLDSYQPFFRLRLGEILLAEGKRDLGRAELFRADSLFARKKRLFEIRNLTGRTEYALMASEMYDLKRLLSETSEPPIVILPGTGKNAWKTEAFFDWAIKNASTPCILLLSENDDSVIRKMETVGVANDRIQLGRLLINDADSDGNVGKFPVRHYFFSSARGLPIKGTEEGRRLESLLVRQSEFTPQATFFWLWTSTVTRETILQAQALGFSHQYVDGRSFSKGLLPAVFHLDFDWPRLRAYVR